jgi:hypothetical protein
MGRAYGRARCCSLLEARWLNAGSRLLGFVGGHRLDPAPLVGAIFLFQPSGCLDDGFDLSATKLITLKQRASDKLNLVPIVLDPCMGAPLLAAKEFALAL